MNLSGFEQLASIREYDCLVNAHVRPALFSPLLFSLSFFSPFERQFRTRSRDY